MTSMEAYYLANTAGFRGKIMMADWIPRRDRAHMVAHVQAKLRQRSKGKKRAARTTFRAFVGDPAAKSAQSKRFVYGKKPNGQLFKKSKADGRFVAFSQKEKAEVKRQHAK